MADTKSNAKRFIHAYNTIDKMIRALYGYKPNYSYTEVVRKSAAVNSVVRKYEDDLLDYGRLRNAIVHNSEDDMVIAEPHDSVTQQIEHIAQLLKTPPKITLICKPAVTLQADAKIIDAIALMSKSNYSNVPVLEGGKIIGVTSHKLIVEEIGRHIEEGIDAYIKSARISDTVSGENSAHYMLAGENVNVEEAVRHFTNYRKLQIIVVTKSGRRDGEIVGVVTTGDLVEMNRILENY